MCATYKDKFYEAVIKPLQDDIKLQNGQPISLEDLYKTIINRTSVLLNEDLDESYRKYRIGQNIFDYETIDRPLSSLAKCAQDFCVELSIDKDINDVTKKLKGTTLAKYLEIVDS